MRIALAVVALIAAPPAVSLATKPPATAGAPWTATLVVRGTSAPLVVGRLGDARVSARARRVSGARHRVRLVFPRAGSWTLTAHARGRTFRLGAVEVRPPLFEPALLGELVFEPDGSLLVIEGQPGRLLRIDPTSGRVAVAVRDVGGVFGLARYADGSVAVSDAQAVWRIDLATGARSEIAHIDAPAQIGPMAVDASGRLFFGTNASELWRVDASGARVLARGLGIPHGVELAPDGSLVVAATENDEIVRVDPETGATTVVARDVSRPLGLAVAADGTIFASEFGARSIIRLAPNGGRTVIASLSIGATLALAPDGTLYAAQSERGIFRLTPGGLVRLRLTAP